jgi:hypothetical protein
MISPVVEALNRQFYILLASSRRRWGNLAGGVNQRVALSPWVKLRKLLAMGAADVDAIGPVGVD